MSLRYPCFYKGGLLQVFLGYKNTEEVFTQLIHMALKASSTNRQVLRHLLTEQPITLHQKGVTMKWQHLVWMGVFMPVFWSCLGDKETDFSREARDIKKTYKPAFAERKIKHLLLYTHSLCQHYGVDYDVVKGVIAAESGWNHLAESSAHCKGLMQISEGAASQLQSSEADLFDPYVNITLGVLYLSWLQGKYNGDTKKMLKAYHEGPGRVDKAGILNYRKDTYVNKVLQLAARN